MNSSSFLSGSQTTVTAGAGQALINDAGGPITPSGGFGHYTTSREAGAPSVTMSWTSNAAAVLHLTMNINAAPVTPAVQWTQTVVNGSPAYGRGKALVKMSNNDVVSACQITAGSGSLANTRITRHAADTGIAVWTRDLDKGNSDDVNDMVVDSAGNIYLAYRASQFGTTVFHLNWYVVKINGTTGAEMWTYSWAGSGEGNDEVFAINTSPDGNVVAVGNAEGGVRARAAKINAATGAEMWAFMEADNTTIRLLNCVICDSAGAVYAGGQWAQADAYMVKLNGSNGALTWSKIINGPGGGIDSAQDVAVDSSDNPIFCGNFPATAGNGDSYVIKLNPVTNVETWRRVFSGSAAAQDGAATVKVDSSNNVYVAGFVRNTLSAVTDRQAYAAKLNGADGSVTWSFTKNGSAAAGTKSADRYYSLELSNSAVYLAGTIANASTDILTTRLDASTGVEQWSHTYDVAGATETLFGGRRHLVVTAADELSFIGETGATSGIVVKLAPASSTAPTVTTAAQSAVTATSATLGGNVTADGGATVTERGIVWGTSTGPTTANNKVANGSGTGTFSGTVTGLPANTTIFVRAYATNSVDTSYGNEISFTTLPPTATISRSPTSVSEDGATNLTYTVTLSTAVPTATTVNITTTGTATSGTDYSGGVTTLTIPANTTLGTITIDPAVDGTVEADETVILTLAAGTGYTVGVPASATGIILNDDVPSATIAVSPSSVSEDGATNLTYTVTLNQASLSTLSVAYTVGGTASNGTDYATVTSPLVIPPGNTTGTITVNPTADAAIEANETVTLTLAAGAGYTVGVPNSATGTIDNDDLPADIQLTLSSGTLTINASGSAGAANLTLRFVTGAGGPFLEVVDTSRTLSAPAGGSQVNANTVRIPVASITSIVLTGSLLADNFTLDFSAGDICPSGGIAVNGGLPNTSPGDTLIIDGDLSSGGSYGTGAPGAGTLTLDTGNTITFTGLEPVDMSASSFTDFTVTVDPGNVFSGNVITTVSAVDAGVNTHIDFGTSGLESAKLGTVTGTLTINGDNVEQDYFVLQGLGSAMTGHFVVDGRGGDADVVDINNTTFTVAGVGKDFSAKADFVGLGRQSSNLLVGNVVCSGNVTLEADGDSGARLCSGALAVSGALRGLCISTPPPSLRSVAQCPSVEPFPRPAVQMLPAPSRPNPPW